ncbi:mandelate racemase/muconate lactonizing enzyme family protein [Ktedonospora formicarum]|uniref:Mandelate racemase n=1 Tax=Ktedonospora formicarum TaxID=2778364 RepID=A0A8J3MY75_9CHLR|nr:enolase C-terminal domain-like protein [Ktedonospora formicarum]GHO50696.1 mandelate racemase [Ktedonospora formicarum]
MSMIQKIDVFPISLPVTQAFRFSSGSAGVAGGNAPIVLVKLTDSEGEVGWGEGRPMPQWAYETIESATTAIRTYLGPAILGQEIVDRWGLHQRMHRAIGRGPSTGMPVAKAAIDMAIHDLCARSTGLPLRSYLGGSQERNTVTLSYTLTSHDVNGVQKEIIAAREKGFHHFNFKAAVTPETDVAVAKAIRQAAGPDAFVWADANQGFQSHEALTVARGFADAGVNVLEQPFPADQLQLMRRLRNQCPVPLAVDEATVSPADFFHYAAEGLVDFLVIKVTRSGGIWPSLQQIAVATSAGLPLLVSGLTDSLLTKLAACQLAAAFGHQGPAALNGSQFLDESALYPDKEAIEFDGSVHLNKQSGIGVQPDPQALTLYLKDI